MTGRHAVLDPADLAEVHRSFAGALGQVAAPHKQADGAAARRALIEAGWLDALAAAPVDATRSLFALQGRLVCETAALDDVVAAELAASWPALAGVDAAVAYPMPEPAGARAEHPEPGRRLLLGAHADATHLVWPTIDTDGRTLLVLFERAGEDGEPVRGIDPDFGLRLLPKQPSEPVDRLDGPDAADAWARAVTRGRVALAHQLAAGSRALLHLARDYALERRQFGHTIGSYQAVRHRLAETLAEVAGAEAAADAADIARTALAGATAKLLAGRAAAAAGRHCLQVFGAIGFTMEHPFHRHFRRNLVLDSLLDDRNRLAAAIGADLRHSGAIPPHAELDDPVPHPLPGGPR